MHMRYDLLIRGGEVVDPAGDLRGQHDIAVTGGTIAAVAPGWPHSHATKQHT